MASEPMTYGDAQAFAGMTEPGGVSIPSWVAELVRCFGLVYQGIGNQRVAYRTRSGRYVVKFPRDDASGGECDNEFEYRSHHGDIWFPTARCRLVTLSGRPCLVMEFVQAIDYDSNPPPLPLPEWTHGVDCQQVGYTRRGELVAYDWA